MSPELPAWASEMAWMSSGDESLPATIPGVNVVLNRLRLASFLAEFAEDKDVRDLLELDVFANAAGLPLTSTGAAEHLPHLAARPFRVWEYAWLYKTLRLSKGGLNVLDLGGPASHLSLLAALAGCRVTSLDINPEFVNAAAECARALKLDSLEGRVGDMRDLSEFPHGSFDVVMSCSVLEHLRARDQRIALRGMARVVKPGGVIGLTFDYGPGAPGANEHLPPPHDPPGSSAEVRRRYIQDGLSLIGNAFSENPIPGSLFRHEFIRYTVASLFLTKPPSQGKKAILAVQAPRPESGKSRLANLVIEKLPYLMFKNLSSHQEPLESSRAETAELQRVAAERLAELDLKDAELSRVRAEGERRTKELERSAEAAAEWEAVSTERLKAMHEKENLIARLNQRAETLEAAAAERLEGMQKREQAATQLYAELKAREAALAAMREHVERAASDTTAQQKRAAKLEATAAERLAEIQEKEQAAKQLHAELKARESALAAMREHVERAALDTEAQQERAAKLEATAAERLAEIQEKEQAAKQLHAELKARESALAAMREHVERAASDTEAQQERAAKLEATAAERLAEIQEKEQAAEQLHAELKARESALAAMREYVERAASDAEAQQERAARLEATAAERLEEMQKKEQAVTQLHAELKARDAALSEMRAAIERAGADAIAQRERTAMFEAAAAERLEGIEAKEQVIGQLHAELKARDAALGEMQAKEQVICQLQAALKAQRARVASLEEADAEHMRVLHQKDKALADLHAERESSNAIMDQVRADLDRAAAVAEDRMRQAALMQAAAIDNQRVMRQQEEAIQNLRAHLDVLQAEKETLVQRNRTLEGEGWRDYIARRARRRLTS